MSLLTPLCPNLPNNLLNGTPADASQVMADFNTLLAALNTTLNQSSATGGDQYVGLTTDNRFNGTSVHDALTQLVDRQSLYTDTGTTNALVITPNPAMGTLAAGQVFWFKPANTTTSGSATITIGSNTAVGIANWDGTLLLAGQLIAGSYYMGVTAGPGNPIRIINPSYVIGSFTGTLTGMSSATTGTINYGTDLYNISLYINADINNTSNAPTLTITGVPALIQPATTHWLPFFNGRDSSSQTQCMLQISSASGTWTVGKGLVGTASFPGAFTNTGNKGVGVGSYSYPRS